MPTEAFFGERLQLAREFRSMTQKQLGDEVAASTALISLCETGKKKDPAADLVEACGSVLGFEPAFFYGTVHDVFRENECSFRHRRSAPERCADVGSCTHFLEKHRELCHKRRLARIRAPNHRLRRDLRLDPSSCPFRRARSRRSMRRPRRPVASGSCCGTRERVAGVPRKMLQLASRFLRFCCSSAA